MSVEPEIFEVEFYHGGERSVGYGPTIDDAAFVAVGQAWGKYLVSEWRRGYQATVPSITTFSDLDHLKRFLAEVESDLEDSDPKKSRFVVNQLS